MSQLLEYYVQNLGQLSPAAFLGRVSCPVLVEVVTADQDAHDNERAFRTEFVSLDELGTGSVDSPVKGEVLLIKKREGALFSGHIGIGRTPNLDVCIPRHGISKFHAYFSLGPTEGYMLTDKDSKNGTFVNGERLKPGVATSVQTNAEIRFAAHTFRFLTPEAFYDLVRSYR